MNRTNGTIATLAILLAICALLAYTGNLPGAPAPAGRTPIVALGSPTEAPRSAAATARPPTSASVAPAPTTAAAPAPAGKIVWTDNKYVHVTRFGYDLGDPLQYMFFNGWKDPDGKSAVLVAVYPGLRVHMPAAEGDDKNDTGWKGDIWKMSQADPTEWTHQISVTRIGSKLDYDPPLLIIATLADQSKVNYLGWTVSKHPAAP